jgi:hypothetical protein
VSERTKEFVAAYVGLEGEWDSELTCPAGVPGSGPLTVGIQTDSIEKMRVILGPDLSKEGIDCHNTGAVLASGRLSLTGSSIGGLSGQTASVTASFGDGGTARFAFDPSYDPTLSTVDGAIMIMPDLSILSVVVFAKRPHSNADGTKTQVGYDCGLELLQRR